MPKVLVTGGTGFVGGPLVRRILQEGWVLSLVTRNKERASQFASRNLSVYEADLTDSRAIDEIAKREGPFDAVFHLAASLNYFGDKREICRTNVEGTRNILNLALKTSARKFIYASSIEAVGPVTKREIPAPPGTVCRPISPYGESKVLAERLVMDTTRSHFPAIILRIGNVYGPDHFSFIVEIANAILKRNRLLEFLPVYADRYIQPVHNDDTTEGIMAAYRSNTASSIVTLAGEYATVGEIFQICAKILGRQISCKKKKLADEVYLILRRDYYRYKKRFDLITYLMAGPAKRVHRAYSLEETRKTLGFSPQVALRNGIAQTLQWARQAGILNF